MLLSGFLTQLINEPITLIAIILLSGVITVNGWTDAPTAIATCISTRSITPKKAVVLAALMNFSGVSVMSLLSGKVVDTVTSIADFGNNPKTACITLSASMLTIILWAVTAWFFGIPTSESHALVASLAGASIALSHNFSSISVTELTKIITGLIISTLTGFLLGFFSAKLTRKFIKNKDRLKTDNYFRYLQNIAAGFMSFMHGAQDGQKFAGVFILIKKYSLNNYEINNISLIIWVSLFMALGTSMGGMRIIKTMGNDMVNLKKYQGFAADFSGASSLLITTLTGLPVSTTHTKTTAIMGVGAAHKITSVDWKIVKDMIFTWIFTFPGCGFLGYLITKIFLFLR